jgi:sugar lactone lactonase YvrE
VSTQTRQQEAEIILRRTSTLGEGALWDAEKQRLYWVDILEHKVFCFDPKTGENQEFDVGEEVGTVVLTQDEMLLVALSSGIALLDPKTQKITRLSDPRQHASEGRFNDGKCDHEGRFWVGTYSEGVGQAGQGALYCFDAGFSATRKLGNVTCSNGLCWNSDRRTFYYVDTPTYQIAAFDFDHKTGAISSRRRARWDGHRRTESALGGPF